MAASTFSYAQAAKGMSTPVTQSKPASGAATPAKDTIPTTVNGSAGPAPSWADDAESESATEQPTTAREVQPQTSSSTPAQPTHSVETSSISSPDLGASASSASTVTKDDDVSSLPNASSESTWDNKSQASTSVDKSAEPVEKTSEKVKKGKNTVVKPLQEAPLPTVNVWKKRADEAKSKGLKTTSPLPNGTSQSNPGATGKKSESDSKVQPATLAGRPKNNDEDRSAHTRKDATDAKKDNRKPFDKDTKTTLNAQPPPSKRDQESWPTPETVINEDRKKAQEKGEKEPKENSSAGSHGKHEWVKVPYTPSVVFSTPLPNAANPRRGGRPGGRGGSQSGGRPAAYGASGASQPEKDGSTPAFPNGDHARRERADGVPSHDASPKAKRTGSAASPTLKDQAPTSISEKPFKASGASGAEAEFRPRTASSAPDSSQPAHQSSTYPRQYSNRPNKPRRGDMSFAGERRRDGEGSPTKDNTFDDRQNSAGAHTDAPSDGERRHSTYHEGSNGHHNKQGRYGAYSGGRERGRGGARGGRGSYANGHQYSNGHMSVQSVPSFSLGPRSPTTFNPENPSFFAAPQGKYSRNGHRSQSVTTDPYRFAPYQAGAPLAPLQTYNMYDYNMMQQPMSAVPYTPYMDQYALMAMITTQV
jgi:la-related protein 1